MRYVTAFVASAMTLSCAHADDKMWGSFFNPDGFPYPDPLFKKLGPNYIYYEQQGLAWTPDVDAKGMQFLQTLPAECALTEVRIAQPETSKGGTISVWTADFSNPLITVPKAKLGELSTSTTLFAGDGAVIQSWDFTSLGVMLAAGEMHILVMDSPMSWYKGIFDLNLFHKTNGQWLEPFPAEIGPAFEVRGNIIPAPGVLAVVGAFGLTAMRRRRNS